MTFTSLVFLVRFLPAALLLYFICPSVIRNWLLILLSILFYAWGDVTGTAVLASVTLLGYLFGRVLSGSEGKKRTIMLASGLICVIGCLLVFKYTGFVSGILSGLGVPISRIDLPSIPGISFFSFTVAAYLIDVYRGDTEVCLNVSDYLLYVLFFPKLLMGPITRFPDLSGQIHDHSVTSEDLEDGALLFVKGLAKKVILADGISGLWEEVRGIGFSSASSLLCWAGIAAFSLEIYFDFSGYSDMALGLGRFFGFSLPENFHTPYSSVSITEFWRRWHITMGQWFRDYVYIPLGGNRCSRLRNLLNLLAVWLLTGLWHGAALNFILWGFYYFLILALERLFLHGFLEKNRLFGHIYTVFVTLIGWALFAVDDLSSLPLLMTRLFGGTGGISAFYYLRNYAAISVICLLLCTEQAESLWNRITQRRSVRTLLTLILLALSIAYIIGSTYHPFMYAQF